MQNGTSSAEQTMRTGVYKYRVRCEGLRGGGGYSSPLFRGAGGRRAGVFWSLRALPLARLGIQLVLVGALGRLGRVEQ